MLYILQLALDIEFVGDSRFDMLPNTYKKYKELYKALLRACPDYEQLDYDLTGTGAWWMIGIAVLVVAGVIAFIRIAALPSLGLYGGMIYYTVEMTRKRSIMRAIAGPRYQENEWGFGQIIALFVWVPVLLKLAEIFSVSFAFRGIRLTCSNYASCE